MTPSVPATKSAALTSDAPKASAPTKKEAEKAIQEFKNLFVRMKVEIGGHTPPSMNKKERIGEFCKFLLGGVLPILIVAAGIACACIFGGPAITAAIASGGGVGAILGSIGGGATLLGVASALASPLASWIIWNAKKVKNTFNIGGSITASRTDATEGQEPLDHSFSDATCKLFAETLAKLEKKADDPNTSSTDIAFDKKQYRAAIKILTDNAARYHITIITTPNFATSLQEAHFFSHLGDTISFEVDKGGKTPKLVRNLIHLLNPKEAITFNGKKLTKKDTYRNMLPFDVLRTKSEKERDTQNELQIEAEEDVVEKALQYFNTHALGPEGKDMTAGALDHLADDLTRALGYEIKAERHEPTATDPLEYMTFGGERLTPITLIKVPRKVIGWKVTPSIIKNIIRKIPTGKPRPPLTSNIPANQAVYQQWYNAVQAEQAK